MINQSNAGRFNPKVFVNCVQEILYVVFSFISAASNFLTTTQCGCVSPLTCDHGQRFAVKLSDFDSAFDVTKVRSRHSVLRQFYRNNPTGTPGYRPPEVCVCVCVQLQNV